MFLDDPHRAARYYYSDLRIQVGSKIFNDSHKLEPYYVSAYAYYKLEFLFEIVLSPRITSLRASISSWHSDISLVG